MVSAQGLPPIHPKQAGPAGSVMLTAGLPSKLLDFIGSLLSTVSPTFTFLFLRTALTP